MQLFMTKRNHKNLDTSTLPYVHTVREINELRDSKPFFPLAFAFHFKKFAKIHFFLLFTSHWGYFF